MNRVILDRRSRVGLMLGTFVVPLVLLSLVGVWLFSVQQEHELLIHAEEVASISCEVLASSVGLGLSEGNFELGQRSYALVRRDSQFVYIGVFDEIGAPLIEYNPLRVSPPVRDTMGTETSILRKDNAIHVASIVRYQGVSFGRVYLIYSLDRVYEKINTARLYSGGAALFVLAIGLYGISLLMKQDKALRTVADQLSRSEQFLNGIVESTPVVIAVKEHHDGGGVVMWNKACEDVYGISRDQIMGRSLSEFLPDDEASSLRQSDREVVLTRSTVELSEQPISTPGKPKRIVRIRKLPLLDTDGLVTHILSVGEDITDKKRWELDLLKAKEAAEGASLAKSEFLANMSHEIRTPMNGIIGTTDLVLRTSMTDQQRRYVHAIKLSADSLLVVINDILDFSKIEAGKLMIERTRFDVRETLGDVIKSIALLARKKHLELLLDVTRTVPRHVMGDPVRTSQVLTNLLGNALKFTEEGEILVRVAPESLSGDTVVLRFTVRDSGIGIPTEKLTSIFESFTQADLSTTRKYGGTGLGLTITTRLLELMKGTIQVESEPGKGSTFSFTIPLGLIEGETESAPQGVERLEGLRVAVLDDNRSNRHLICDSLAYWQMRPTSVEHAWNLQNILVKAEQNQQPYRLVIVDSRMPDAKGSDIIRAISTLELKTRPQFIMLSDDIDDITASDDPASRPELVLEKPVKQSELFDGIMTVLDKDQPLVVRKKAGGEGALSAVPLNVLLVEDHVVNQELAMGILALAGHKATLARNGKEAVESLAWQTFDVVLMDVQMPEMDGFQATAIIREREKETGGHVPIVAMTAHAMSGYREKCLAAGMDDYLSKPVRAGQLLELLKKFSPRTIATPPATRVEASAASGVHSASELPSLAREIFDSREACHQCLDNIDLARRVVESFIDSLPSLKEDLRQALARNDGAALAKAAHTLKGATGSIVAQRSSRASLAVEQAAKAGDLVKAAAAWETLSSELESLEEAIADFMAISTQANAARRITTLQDRKPTLGSGNERYRHDNRG